MIGRILGNRYQVVEKIGDGGTAFVFRGLDSLLNRSVTVKVLRPEYVSDQDFVRRFRREAQAAASLSHPNIVSIYDVGQEDGIHYIVMEYVKGQSLKEQINNLGRLPLRVALDYACQIAHALSHAHRHGIIHRDVKPHNILINEEGRVKVTDFGIAHAVTAATVTYNGAILGSVHYFSPEQACGGYTGDKSDIYSLGVVLYEMLSGNIPFAGDTPVSVALKHVQEPFPDVRVQNGEVPAAVSQIIRRAVAKDPEKRYDSARKMAQDLTDFMQGRSLPPVVDDGEEKPLRQTVKGKGKRPFPWRAVVLGSLLLVLLAVLAGVMQLREMLVVPEVDVPLVEGESLTNATRILEESGLKNYRIVESLHDEEVPPGHVLRQFPAAGRKAKKTRQIELTLSAGPVLVVIEGVTGKTELEATLVLEGLGFEVWPVREYSEQEPAGTVIRQDPGEGFTLPRGSRVTITVSQGGRPFPMKDLTRATLEEARVWLELFGLRQRLVDQEESEHPAGTVVRQSPAAGEMVQAGDFVDLVVSSGPAAAAAYPIKVNTADIPRGELITIFIRDAQGPREELYVSTGEVIQTFGYGSGTVEVRWLNQVKHITFP
jgi:serine/threonine-protein kinase